MPRPHPPTDRCLSNLALDRLLAGELDEGAGAAARLHLDGCAHCGPRFRELEADRDRFRAAPPALSLPAPAADPARAPGRASPTFALAASGALAAALVVFLQLRARPGGGPAPRPDDELARTKGGVRLGFYVKRQDSVLEGRSGDVVHPGDAVRFSYSSPTAGYLIVVSRDGAGRVSVYYPDGDTRSAAQLPAGADEVLPGSVVLDDAVGPEVVHGILCRAPVPAARIVETLRTSGETGAISGCTADRLTLDKR